MDRKLIRRSLLVIGCLIAVGVIAPTLPQQQSAEAAPVPQVSMIQWISLRGGSFIMGEDSIDCDLTGEASWPARVENCPSHKVSIRSFQMSKTEVTVGQYRRCVRAGKCSKPTTNANTSPYCNWSKNGREDHPINCVSWYQARTFAHWMGARLPSESEWEYAASGLGRKVKYPWGGEEPSCKRAVMDDKGSYDDPRDPRYPSSNYGCAMNRTWSVCSKTAGNTPQGLCDMAGNVSEWVEDDFHYTYLGAPVDGTAWVLKPQPTKRQDIVHARKICRGGHFQQDSDRTPLFTNTNRRGNSADFIPESLDEVGFRIAK